MSPIEWCADYMVGHDDIDAQHKRLVEIINTLGQDLEGPSPLSIDQTLNALAQYTIYHFSYEEALFSQSGYPDFLVHQEQHKHFIDKVLTYRDDFENGNPVDAIKLYAFLKMWLVNHICVSDKKMFTWVDETSA